MKRTPFSIFIYSNRFNKNAHISRIIAIVLVTFLMFGAISPYASYASPTAAPAAASMPATASAAAPANSPAAAHVSASTHVSASAATYTPIITAMSATATAASRTASPASLSTYASAAATAFAAPYPLETIGRIQARDYLLNAARRYNAKLRADDILKGGPGIDDSTNSRPATRAEAIVMISRAFGPLPEPVGNMNRSGAAVAEFSDVPDWAMAEVSNLARAKILLPANDNILRANEPISAYEFKLIISRIYASLARVPQDDFYNTINKKWLDESRLRPGESYNSKYDELSYTVESQVNGLLDTIFAGVWPKGSKEQKIADLYRCIMNLEGRDYNGYGPIKQYLENIAQAPNLEMLDAALYRASEDLATDLLFSMRLEPDIYNSNKYSIYFYYPEPYLPKNVAMDPTSPQMTALFRYAFTLFSISGNANPYGSATSVLEIDSRLAKAQRDPSQPVSYMRDYKKYETSRLQALLPDVNVGRLYTVARLEPEKACYIADIQLLRAFAGIYTDENLKDIKAYAMFRLLDACSDMLNQAFMEARYTFANELMGMPERPTTDRVAREKVRMVMSAYLGEMYAEKYFPQATKSDVENMVKAIIDIYKKRIEKLDWMDETSKATAKKKLDEINIKVGTPQSWDTILDTIFIRSPAEGGTYFSNMTAYYRQARAANAKRQGRPVDKTGWDTGVFAINAYYKPGTNEIVLPAGILQAPFYVYGGAKEANYGGIGCIIAHELTHAIDYTGAQFNEKGNAENWWSAADTERYKGLSAGVVKLYDGYEAAPGIVNRGDLTLNENIADLGMITCVIDAVKSLPNPKYELFFTTYAETWASTATRETLTLNAKSDPHASSNARVNKTLQNCAQFYETYGVEPSDGMYLAPDKRISIW